MDEIMHLMYNFAARVGINVQPRALNVMKKTNLPLGLTALEIQDTVEGYVSLTEHAALELMNAEDMHEMTPTIQRRVLGHMIASPNAVVAEVGGSALVVTQRWVVSIHGDSIGHCIDAFLKYRNAVATQLTATVTGVLLTPVVDNTGPLRDVVVRRQKNIRTRNNVKTAGWTLAGAIAGAAIGIFGGFIVGS